MTVVDDVTIDERAINDFFANPTGPLAEYLLEIAERAAAIARAQAPVRRPGSTWSARSTARPVGFLRASIQAGLDADVNAEDLMSYVQAAANPALFVEHPVIGHEKDAFLSTSLDLVTEVW